MLNTLQRVALARFLSRGLIGVRRVVGASASACVTRGGVKWELDLAEGIDLSIYLLGAFEPRTVSTYKRIVKPGDTVLDIGANIGAHTLPLARIVGEGGHIHAFEPTAFAFEKLMANLARNPQLAGCVQANQAMLVESEDTDTEPEIYSSWPLSDTEGVHALHAGRAKSTEGARAFTLDAYASKHAIDRVDFVKLDVDGHEGTVLAGANEVLDTHRPVVLMEFAPYVFDEGGFDRMVALVADRGYAFEDAGSGRALPAEGPALRKAIPFGASWNVIARPQG